MEFRASLDKFMIIMTFSLVSLLIFLPVLIHFFVDAPYILIMSLIGLLLNVILFFFAPKSYLVEAGKLTINKGIGQKLYDLSGVKEIRLAEKDELRYSLRTLGVGGFLGDFGMFWVKSLGSMTWYCTKKSNYIIIRLSNNKIIVITPDDVDNCLTALQNTQ